MRGSWIAAGVVAATLFALGAQTTIVARTGFLAGDFRAFYCAARVAAQGADPYRAQPLRSCENAVAPNLFFRKNPGVTIPSPLPGYAIAALMPLSLLPFAVAAGIWIALLLLAWIVAVATLWRFAGVTWQVALATFALSLGALSLPFGEVVPLSVGCICAAAYCAWRNRPVGAALFAAGAMIEPHLGLPACVALACWLPATRWPLGLSLGALGAVSLAALGLSTNLEYFASVLPAHALSEATRDTQYSLSAILSALGLTQSTAIRIGGLWYVGMLVAGTLAGGRLAQKTGNNAFIVCVPPAFAVFGGSFIHVTQIAAAIPAALLLLTYAQPKQRAAALIALLLLVVPWGWVVSPALLVAPLVPVGVLAWWYSKSDLKLALIAALAAAVMVFGLQHLYTLSALHFGVHGAAPSIDPRLAEASWSEYSRKASAGTLAAWAVRIPTWAALGFVLFGLARDARVLRVRRDRAAAIILAVLCTALPITAQFSGDRASGWLAVDFRAYYCAALAQREGHDPYYAQPLHDCEASTPAPYYRAPPNVTVPAPYPPYVLALLAPFTFEPFSGAVTLWLAALALAVALAAYALARLAGSPTAIGWAALGLALGLTSFSPGNLMPVGFAAVVIAAWCVARSRPVLAVFAMLVAMVEPHIALPAAIGLFVAFPAYRLTLALGVGLLGAFSVIGGGFFHTLEYVTAVLPAHALAEVSRDNQYSLATVAAAFGLPDGAAALVGSLSYLAMIAAGVVIGVRLARRYDDPALVVLVPPAFSLLGGSFVHTGEIAAAVPAALLLFMRAGEYRAWLLAALILLAVPWMFATSIALFLAPVFPVGYLVYALWRRDRTAALAAALASFVAITALFLLAAHFPGHAIARAHVYPPIDPRLAEASWRAFVLTNSTNNPVMWLLRAPTWLGLLCFAVPALLLARKPRIRLARYSLEPNI